MARERQAKPMGEFFKFTEPGQVVAGKVTRFVPARDADSTDAFILEPAIIREGKDEPARMFLSCAVGLSTDISQKTEGIKDVGKFMSFRFTKWEPGKKGKKKVFQVVELDADELAQIYGRAEDVGDVYKRPAPVTAGDDGIDEDGDDFGF